MKRGTKLHRRGAHAAVVAVLAGCEQPHPERFAVYQRLSEGYEIAPRELPGLADAQRMTGDLGTMTSGGTVRLSNDGTMSYASGRSLDLRYEIVDGVAWPSDEHGLILWSFWAHLGDVRDELERVGQPLGDVLPVTVAYAPSVPDIGIELLPAENAAYATGGNLFVLLPDLFAEGVPLAANLGIVAHETGHAVFHLLSTGSADNPPIFGDVTTEAGMWEASLHEGFADSLAVLLLDDPRFLEASMAMPERDADSGATISSVQLPDSIDPDSTLFYIYDPYPLGTVFASLAWDLRLASDDPDAVLGVLFDAVVTWSDTPDDPWSYLDAVVEGGRDLGVDGCGLASARFPGVMVASCR